MMTPWSITIFQWEIFVRDCASTSFSLDMMAMVKCDTKKRSHGSCELIKTDEKGKRRAETEDRGDI